jgi:hypothetical protein
MSSTKGRWEICTENETWIPFKYPFLLAYFMSMLSPSTSNMKKKHDKDYPCLSPLEGLKKSDGEPLINTTKKMMIKSHNPVHSVICLREIDLQSNNYLFIYFNYMHAFVLFQQHNEFVCCRQIQTILLLQNMT